jgi:hypothetical protein
MPSGKKHLYFWFCKLAPTPGAGCEIKGVLRTCEMPLAHATFRMLRLNATVRRVERWFRPGVGFGVSPKARESIKMRQQIALIVCSTVFGLMTLSSPVIAQQKTAKACREEWQANKAANQANGITEKAYVTQCRAGGAPATTTTTETPAAPPVAAPEPKEAATGPKTAKACREEWRANKAANQANGITEKAYVTQCRGDVSPAQTTAAPPQPPPATSEPTAAATKQKTAKECREEWRANKAANQASGVTEKAYVTECRSGAAPAQTSAAPTQAPNPTPVPTAAPAPAPTAAVPPARPAPPPATTGPAASVPEQPATANEFSTEAQAKTRCPTDTIVWVNLTSKVYHFSGTRSYGNTKRGAYMCEHDTAAAGMRAAKNETHP